MATNQQMHKFPMERYTTNQTLRMPRTAKIMSLQVQNGVPTMWAMVTLGDPMVDRNFETRDTGEDIPDGYREYVGTYVLTEYVGHVFERR